MFALGPHVLMSQTSSDASDDSTISIRGHHPDNVLFRVYDAKSASPYTTAGYAATRPQFRPDGQYISGSTWRRDFNHLYFNRKLRKADATRVNIIRHVLGGWSGYTNQEYTAPSGWISTTRSFDWALWETVRRLVVNRRDQVGISIIRREYHYAGTYRGNRSLLEDADAAIGAYGTEHGLTEDERAAWAYSKSSSETLVYGRIFPKDILETRLWTRSDPAYSRSEPFMEAYFKPRKQCTGSSWIDRLVFSPTDRFSTAKVKIEERRDQLERSRRVPRRSYYLDPY